MEKAKTALVVIDVQNYFINKYTRHLPASIAAHISSGNYGVVVLSQFVNSGSSGFSRIFGWTKCSQPPDTDICPELARFATAENVFRKSGFSAFRSGMADFLRSRGVSHVFLCGTDTDACVLASAFDAFELGFKVSVLYDLCASTNGKRLHKCGVAVLERNIDRPPQ